MGISSWMAELKCLLHGFHYYNSTDRSLAVINPESSPTCEGPYVKLKLTFHFSDHHHSSYTRSTEGPKTGGCLIFRDGLFMHLIFFFEGQFGRHKNQRIDGLDNPNQLMILI